MAAQSRTSARREREIQKILTPVRGAVKGWAFADEHGRASRLRTAEGLVAHLPADQDLRDAAEEILAPLRQPAERGD